MIIAGVDHFANGGRPFQSTLNAARPGIANIGDHLIGILFENRPELVLETLGISKLINSIGGEDGQLATQNQSPPTVRYLRDLGGGKP